MHGDWVNVKSATPISAPAPNPAAAPGDPHKWGKAVQVGLYPAYIRGLARSTWVHTSANTTDTQHTQYIYIHTQHTNVHTYTHTAHHTCTQRQYIQTHTHTHHR